MTPARRIAVVGATGAVGRELLAILAARGIGPERVAVLASARCAGTRVEAGGFAYVASAYAEAALDGAELAFFAAPAEVARRAVPDAVRRGALAIDNSAAFRGDPRVPLVVPEVNGSALAAIAAGAPGAPRIVANPNCTAILLSCALAPLARTFGLEAADVATYQAVSGRGAAAIQELLEQARGRAGETPAVFHEPCAFNVFSHDSAVDRDSGANGEEDKVLAETRRILALPELRLTVTCMRVPVLRAHTEVVHATLARPAREAEVRAVLAAAPSLALVDDRGSNHFPTPLRATGRDDVLIGRIRLDPARPEAERELSRRVCFVLAGDQLRKGASLNAVAIAVALGAL